MAIFSRRPPVLRIKRLKDLEGEERKFLAGRYSRLSEARRVFRIMLELIRGFRAFHWLPPAVTVFGSARFPEGHRYYVLAQEIGEHLAKLGFAVVTGGGPGIMEAANRGAADAGGRSIGLNIGLPDEQRPNGWITPGLGFEFHYFFMRKLWFAHPARAIVVFPGGFGTLDELFEILTLCQTGKLDRPIRVLLYGATYWREIVDFGALARHGMIGAKDLELLHFVETPEEALTDLKNALGSQSAEGCPAFARTRTPEGD